MDITVEASIKAHSNRVSFFLMMSPPYNLLGDSLWELNDEEYILELIHGVEKTIAGEWTEPLPLDFGSPNASLFVYQDFSFVSNHNSTIEVRVPTVKVLHVLNIWLNFIRFVS